MVTNCNASRALVHFVITLVLVVGSKSRAADNATPQCELSVQAKDVFLAELAQLLVAMRTAEHDGELEAEKRPNDSSVVRKKTKDQIVGIYWGWTAEVVDHGGAFQDGIQDGVVQPKVLSRMVFVNRMGFSESETLGIHEGVKLVAKWRMRIQKEYREWFTQQSSLLERRETESGLSAKDGLRPDTASHDPGGVPLADMPSLEALLYCRKLLKSVERVQDEPSRSSEDSAACP